ncbi:hypothetical protein F2Q69_00006173 [Brassica cretica]|uniref:Uncharacterized protein n=1 Tax=Brassica cretica TaxID=69181 RepID=A0A8S9NUR4_BRACR|nr:hypothetical protein F2Q69_00006173 [Brassica cretica]
MFGPTHLFGEVDGLLDLTRPFGELESGPSCPFGELDDGCFAVRDPLSEALSNLSRRLILCIHIGIVANLILVVKYYMKCTRSATGSEAEVKLCS